jgi:hypothetical protein
MSHFIRYDKFSIEDVAEARKIMEKLVEMAYEKLEYLEDNCLRPPMDSLTLKLQISVLHEIINLQGWIRDMDKLLNEHLINQPARGDVRLH